MKYYSDKLNKIFETPEELKKAEKVFDTEKAAEAKKKEERATRAKEVEDAYKKYQDLLDKFLKDYGAYHTTIKETHSLADLLLPFIW